MKKVYLTPQSSVRKAGSHDFILQTTFNSGSKGTKTMYMLGKERGGAEDDADFGSNDIWGNMDE